MFVVNCQKCCCAAVNKSTVAMIRGREWLLHGWGVGTDATGWAGMGRKSAGMG